jgi:hypothetical protein
MQMQYWSYIPELFQPLDQFARVSVPQFLGPISPFLLAVDCLHSPRSKEHTSFPAVEEDVDDDGDGNCRSVDAVRVTVAPSPAASGGQSRFTPKRRTRFDLVASTAAAATCTGIDVRTTAAGTCGRRNSTCRLGARAEPP